MIYPKFLKKGNTIGVPAPSSGSYDENHSIEIKNSIKKISNIGYNVVTSKNIYNNNKGRSASGEIRGNEINEMFKNSNIDFLITLAGGSFIVECLQYIDFEYIAKHPKFIQGFSDPTGIIFPLTTKYDIATIYGKNFASYGMEKYSRDIIENLEIISGNMVMQKSYQFYQDSHNENAKPTDGYSLDKKVEWKILDGKNVNITGRVIAGCLDVIIEIAGTKYDGTNQFVEKYKDNGIIWFFDVCGLSKEEIICYIWKLNELGYFKYSKGILFGRCGEDITFNNYTMRDALQDSVISKLKIPIIFDTDISHKKPNMTIINGSIVKINVENGKGSITHFLD